jgi:hypothetical protein
VKGWTTRLILGGRRDGGKGRRLHFASGQLQNTADHSVRRR